MYPTKYFKSKGSILPLLLITLLMACNSAATAQSCCCTGAGANYSILPNLDRHVVGLRYSYGRYNTTVFPAHSHIPGMDMTAMQGGIPAIENINTLEAFGRFNLSKRFQLSAFIPVNLITTHTSGNTEYAAGLGDISLLLQYLVLDPLKCHGTKSKHQLRFGAGIKAPTGRFRMTDDGMFATDLQLGTGSVDFLFNAIYTYRYQQFGLNVVGSYKKNLVNAQHFRFGDRVRFGSNAFYIFKLPKEVSIMPAVGANYNYLFYNRYQKEVLRYTGGSFLSCDLGFDIYYKHIGISTTVSPVLFSVSNWSGAAYPTLFMETGVYYNFATSTRKKNSAKQTSL